MSIQFLFAGDFAPNEQTEKYITKNKPEDFWGELLPVIRDSDFSILNLESPLTNATVCIRKIGFPHKAAPRSINLVHYGSFQAVCLANNHIMDYGITGVQETISVCRSNALLTVGAGMKDDFDKPLYVEIKNKMICILNYCENEFSSAKLHGYGANPLDSISNYYNIIEAKQNADVIIVIIHGGREYHHLPLPSFKQLCEFYIDAGADAVVGHHPHYYGGYSYYKCKPIFFSLGNLYADSKKRDEKLDSSYLLFLEFGKHSITHKIVGIKKENKSLRLMNVIEQNQLLEFVHSINQIIDNNEKLESYWNTQKKEFDYYLRIFRFRNKWLYKLVKRLPILKLRNSNSYSLTMQNMIQCESHRELLFRALIRLNRPFEKDGPKYVDDFK